MEYLCECVLSISLIENVYFNILDSSYGLEAHVLKKSTNSNYIIQRWETFHIIKSKPRTHTHTHKISYNLTEVHHFYHLPLKTPQKNASFFVKSFLKGQPGHQRMSYTLFLA